MSCFWNRRTVARFKSTPGMMLFLSWTSCLPELMNLLHFGSIAILMLDCFVIGSQLSLQFSCWLRFRFLRALQELLRDSLFCLWPKSSPSFSREVPCDCPRLSRWCCPCANGLAKKTKSVWGDEYQLGRLPQLGLQCSILGGVESWAERNTLYLGATYR